MIFLTDLLTDIDKMTNNQKISYTNLNLNRIPVSNNLKKMLVMKSLSKINYISNGDDYQILFTASKSKRRIIQRISSNYKIKLTQIGSIESL